MQDVHFLALGDSYTIGETLPLRYSFPYQTVQMLRAKGKNISAPEIIAKTGWTTDELEAGMEEYQFLSRYDFVTLLIGVNNQYRERTVIEYKEQLEHLLNRAIALSGDKKEKVAILSIPDYSIMPSMKDRDPGKISHEIDLFNSVSRALSVQYKVHYIDITEGTREASGNPALIAEDGLHPSAAEYEKWAKQVSEWMLSVLK